ncbi:hypothetical protein HPB52_009323 [Rhipicephalus sanguineus]|uniref:Uncharacterized protein n=1 Tax=Rhipicephalus sanguineus TaxID=34632 RepID=A0A9D4Q026_RHISA|nr:hypothetical protein HPB52_009323 [Rhipicephalus sanguineus]
MNVNSDGRLDSPRKKWIPGIVRDQQGKRMVTVDTTQGTERRHFDQVRRRDVSVDESAFGRKRKRFADSGNSTFAALNATAPSSRSFELLRREEAVASETTIIITSKHHGSPAACSARDARATSELGCALFHADVE